MKEIRITEDMSRQRLDKFLQRYLPAAPVGLLYKMIRKKNITVNGKKTDGKQLLAAGDVVALFFADETIDAFQRPNPADATAHVPLATARILYEDPHLLLVNKPAGHLTQKAAQGDVSLTEEVLAYLSETGKRTPESDRIYRPGPANRLDRNTSGIVAFPLTLSAAQELADAFLNRSVRKQYLAVAEGRWDESEEQTGWIRRDPQTRTSRVEKTETKDSVPVALRCRCLDKGDRGSLLAIDLLTGKTHQIRAQLSSIGFPLVGDPKYGKIKNSAEDPGIRRQALHAWKMQFPVMPAPLDALSGMTVTAPVPDDLLRLIHQYHLQVPLSE